MVVPGTVFLIMITFSTILLFLATLSATIAISYISNSSSATDPAAQDARLYLVAACVIGWMVLVGLILLLIFGSLVGGFRTTDYAKIFSDKTYLTLPDLKAIVKDKNELTTDQHLSLIIFILIIIVTIFTLIISILCIVAATRINSLFFTDDNSNAAYIWSITGATTGIVGTILLIVSIVMYAWYRTERKHQVEKLDETVKIVGTRVPEYDTEGERIGRLVVDSLEEGNKGELIDQLVSPYLSKIPDGVDKIRYIEHIIQPYVSKLSPDDAETLISALIIKYT